MEQSITVQQRTISKIMDLLISNIPEKCDKEMMTDHREHFDEKSFKDKLRASEHEIYLLKTDLENVKESRLAIQMKNLDLNEEIRQKENKIRDLKE